MALWLYGSLFVHENGRGSVFMAMTTRMMIYAFLLYGGIFAAIVAVVARVIKYLIRYGIDYYFEKLAEYQKHKED